MLVEISIDMCDVKLIGSSETNSIGAYYIFSI